MKFSKTNEFTKTPTQNTYLLLQKNLTNQKSLMSLGNKLVIAGTLVQHAINYIALDR